MQWLKKLRPSFRITFLSNSLALQNDSFFRKNIVYFRLRSNTLSVQFIPENVLSNYNYDNTNLNPAIVYFTFVQHKKDNPFH